MLSLRQRGEIEKLWNKVMGEPPLYPSPKKPVQSESKDQAKAFNEDQEVNYAAQKR